MTNVTNKGLKVNFDSSANPTVRPTTGAAEFNGNRRKAMSEWQIRIDEESGNENDHRGGGGILSKGANEPNRRKAMSECNVDEYVDNDGVIRSSRVDASSRNTTGSNGAGQETLGGVGGGVARSSRLPNLRYEPEMSQEQLHHHHHTNAHVSIDVADPLGTPPPIGQRSPVGDPYGAPPVLGVLRGISGEDKNPLNLFEHHEDDSPPRPNAFALHASPAPSNSSLTPPAPNYDATNKRVRDRGDRDSSVQSRAFERSRSESEPQQLGTSSLENSKVEVKKDTIPFPQL